MRNHEKQHIVTWCVVSHMMCRTPHLCVYVASCTSSKGRGKEGKGTGQDFLTLKKPQPLSRVGVFCEGKLKVVNRQIFT